MKMIVVMFFSLFATATPDSRMDRLTKAFEQIKGCYWMDEDLLDPLFRRYHGKPKSIRCKTKDPVCREIQLKTEWTASTITGVHDSWVYFDPQTKKPLKVAFIELIPHNQTPGYEVQLVVDPESFEVKGNEIRGGFLGPILDRDHTGTSDEELKKTENREREVNVNQSFKVVGNRKKGLTILISDTRSGVFNYVLRPARREDCVSKDYLEAGPDKPMR